jgi:RHS repeat-associated protein
MQHVIKQIDGSSHATKYTRNMLGQVTEVEDALKHKTTKTYDAAGNLKEITDPAKRTTTYKYDSANQLSEVSYSEAGTHTVKYEYDADGKRVKMEDGTGTSKYAYDQLDRLTESKDGHGDVVKYEYDLASQQTKITYPNGKAVTRAYDKAGRLESVKDWLEHTMSFGYDQNSNQNKTTFPNNEDKYTYDEADQLTKTEMKKGAEALAVLTYARENGGQLKSAEQTGLPGEAEAKYTYDENDRLTKAGASEYEYDAANNPAKIGAGTGTYNEGDELAEDGGVKYSYDELGERTKRTPAEGQATAYGYDQAGNLTTVDRAKEGETPAIEDSYSYDGEGLRSSQTVAGTTKYLVWDASSELPLLLDDGTNSYIYGPNGLPVEQISTGGTILYLHHDQQGSTRVITGSTGNTEGKCSYSAYGVPTCEGSATTRLGYDGQYTSADTGLVYLRARVYDPSTALFLSVDPLAELTGERYSYAGDDPLNRADVSGLWPGEGLVRGVIDFVAAPVYGVYFLNYEVARGINAVGEELGPVGSTVSHVVATITVPGQAVGLGLDVAIDALKNALFGDESICDEGVTGYLNPLHSFLSKGPIAQLQHPDPAFLYHWLEARVYLPGVHSNGSRDFEW